ncbi:hypothetical protein [Xenorhabdus ishibashii]|uniref:Uncharacterized protein n=1 Tax=Xenorhabdus ishibashii TaxID=1034471 RepID=A0A2D0K7Z0_9GAMM|nr:hypothetical protein [Xenorhabdus ishibashii]PHM59495.1 hypothetical protein Xish_03613 [Xenorhabdus ishibashii]
MMKKLEKQNSKDIPIEIYEVTHYARQLFDHLLDFNSLRNTKGTCLHASLLLAFMLERAGFESKVCGGDGLSDGGLFTKKGGHGHYWCEVKNSPVSIIIDITADQFGFEKIIIKMLDDINSWPKYIAGDREVIEQHIIEYRSE